MKGQTTFDFFGKERLYIGKEDLSTAITTSPFLRQAEGEARIMQDYGLELNRHLNKMKARPNLDAGFQM